MKVKPGTRVVTWSALLSDWGPGGVYTGRVRPGVIAREVRAEVRLDDDSMRWLVVGAEVRASKGNGR